MTGQNALDSVIVAGGVLSTYSATHVDSGTLFKPGASLVVMGDKTNPKLAQGPLAELHLFGDESLKDVSVLQGGRLSLTQSLNLSGSLLNLGELVILGVNGPSLQNEVLAAVTPSYLPDGFSSWEGSLKVGGDFRNVNTGSVLQSGDVAVAGSLVNQGRWAGIASTVVGVDMTNDGLFNITGNLSVARDLTNQGEGKLAITGDLTVNRNLANAAASMISVNGSSAVEVDLTNQGVLSATGPVGVGNQFVNQGIAAVEGMLEVGGSLTNRANATLAVVGDTSVKGSVNNGGNLSIVGQVSVIQDLANSGVASVLGATTVGQNFDNSGQVRITGDLAIGNNLQNAVASTMYLTGNSRVLGNASNAGGLEQNGNMSVEGSIQNDGFWRITKDSLLQGADLSGNGIFCLSTSQSQDCSGGVGSKLSLELKNDSLFNGVFTGEGALTKTGQAKLILTEAQSFAGPLTISDGAIETTERAVMADSVDVIVGAGGTYIIGVADKVNSVTNNGANSVYLNADLTTTKQFVNNGRLVVGSEYLGRENDVDLLAPRSLTTAGLAGAETGLIRIDQGGVTFRLIQSGDSSYAGSIAGAGSVEKLGLGTIFLTGANTFTGGLTVTEGTVNTTGGGTLSDLGAISVGRKGTFLAGSNDTVGVITNQGVLTINASISTPSIRNQAGGVLHVNGLLTTTGNSFTNDSGATTNLASNIVSAGKVTNDGVLNVQGLRTIESAGFQGSGLTNLLDAADLTVTQKLDSVYAGQITGAGSLSKAGSGVLNLTGQNTFTGGLSILAGELSTARGGTLADTLSVRIAKEATFRAATPDAIGSVTNQGNVVVETPQRFSSLINQSGAALNLQSNLEVQGAAVNDGTVTIDGATRLLSTGGLSGATTGAVALNQSLVLDQKGTSSYAGSFSGNGTLVKAGDGVLTLSKANGVNLAGGLTIEKGAVALDGPGILANALDVRVLRFADGTFGTLRLVTGDQSIKSLAGSGVLALGSNGLTIDTGGDFSGEVTGTGRLSVRTGDFTVRGALTSSDPKSEFVIGGGANQSTSSRLILPNSGSLKFPTVSISGQGATASVAGKVDASNAINVTSTGTNLATVANLHMAGGTVTSPVVNVAGGKITGSGVLNSTVNLGESAWLNPGDSPGMLGITALNAGSGSTIISEIGRSGVRDAGINFDQIIVSGKVTLSGSSKLQLRPVDSLSSVQAGELVSIFRFAPGAITGSFGSVDSVGLGSVGLALGTGNVVGLGVTNQEFTTQVARYQNQKDMLSDLKVSETGGVPQYYGGRLVERLAATRAANPQDTKAIDLVFSRSTPEVYGALQDQSKSSLLYSSVDLLNELEPSQRGMSAEYLNRGQRNEGDNGYARYNLRNWGLKLGYGDSVNGWNWRADIVAENPNIRSKDLSGAGEVMSASGNGVTLSVGTTKESVSTKGLFFTGKVAAVMHNTDLTRRTNQGFSFARDVDSNARMMSLGLAYLSQGKTSKLSSSFELFGYQSKVDPFIESNTVSAYDALMVHGQRSSGVGGLASISLSGAMSEKFDYSLGAKIAHFGHQGSDVTANLTTEATRFTVRSEGVDKTQMSLNAGGRFKLGAMQTLQFGVGAYGNGGYQANFSYRKLY
jgi:autotransporter-associated beta strand protein